MRVQYPKVGDPAADLSWARRVRDLTELAETSTAVDLVVIGGGITGTGIALDAASRGLSTVLVERDGRTERVPVVDATRIAQLFLLGLGFVFFVVGLMLSVRN